MKLIKKSIALGLAVLLGTSHAMAQDETDIPEGAPSGLYIGEVFGDWAMRCLSSEEGPDPCELAQVLFDANENRVAEVVVVNLPIGGQAVAGAAITTPLETALLKQLTLQVDEKQPKRYPFRFCDTKGCHANIGLTFGELQEWKAGANTKMTIFPYAASDREVNLNISLTGFTAAYQALLAQNAPQ